jgi:hypothetical protein
MKVNIPSVERLKVQNTHRYSNITCAPTNMQAQAPPRNLRPETEALIQFSIISYDQHLPDQVPMISLTMYNIPSVPIAKPTRLADIIIRILKTAPTTQACRYHGLSPYYHVHDQRLQDKRMMRQEITFDAGSKYLAANSGAMNKLTSHPHASSRNDRSCHKATNVKIRTVQSAPFFVPPRGMYIYLDALLVSNETGKLKRG